MKHSFKKILSVLVVVVMVFVLSQVSIRWPQEAEAQKSAEGSSGKYWTESASDKKSDAKFDVEAYNKFMTDLVKSTAPAVVNIYTKTKMRVRRYGGPGMMDPNDIFRYFFGNPFGGGPGFDMPQQQESQSLGTGFIINLDGIIISNAHVVQPNGRPADEISIKFKDQDAKGYEAKLIGVDPSTDVAVLKLKKKMKNLTVLPLGDSDKVQQGEGVIAIGNPFGQSNTVTRGIISALGREVDPRNRANFIQTDASINPGNSGGPLINLKGEAIGINSMIYSQTGSSVGIGYAIPMNIAKNVIRQILDHGEVTYGWIGVGLAEVSPEIAAQLGAPVQEGALIQEVFPGGPADKTGIQAYDLVVEAGGKPVKSTRDLMTVVGSAKIGSKVEMKLYRDGKLMKTSVEIAKRESESKIAKLGRGAKRAEPFEQPKGPKVSEKTGLALTELSPQVRRKLGFDGSVQGVFVHNVEQGSLADEAGIAPGDVIEEINRKAVKSVSEAEKLLSGAKGSLLLKVRRGNASVIMLFEADSSQAKKSQKKSDEEKNESSAGSMDEEE